MIPDDHPLQKLFMELVARHYAEEIVIRDSELVGYVAHLLTDQLREPILLFWSQYDIVNLLRRRGH